MVTDLTVNVHVDAHGALEDNRLGIWRRTVALWMLMIAGRLLRTRLTVRLEQGE